MDFIEILKDEIRKMITKQADRLIEDDPEKYYMGRANLGSHQNGIGFVSDKGERVYDEDQAYDDAQELIAEDVANGSGDLETAYNLFIDNNKLTSALAELIKEL